MGEKVALIAGATGLVGAELVHLLLADPAYGEVRTLVRRPLPWAHAKLSQHIVNFETLAEYQPVFEGAHALFCSLGTTMKKAGSQVAFRKVDHDYPLRLAQCAHAAGVSQYLLVTAMGADPRSRVFYNRVKGEVEEAIGRVGMAGFHIARPSLLLGDRQEFRMGEAIAAKLSPAVGWAMGRYRPIHGQTVARAMQVIAAKGERGRHVYENDQLHRLGGE